MRSTITIGYKERYKRYYAAASGKFGGGYSNAQAGDTPEKAAAFAAREMIRYAQSNPEGGSLIAPPEVMALVPEHLREVDGGSGRRDKWLQVRVTPDESDRISAEAATAGKSVSEYVRDRALRKK